ncbi:prolyl 3-hydroxylase OGFOD1 [Solenopsis invicta]|uniref:prolyl 3-hydroxylase OGFOD1 n=1 Tax=Solenopsis invicta TaxID=13686 RepID=UPI0001FE9AD5|nr:prolyl 3-hydroxylase OGFOD1 [Solenopsis invicta]
MAGQKLFSEHMYSAKFQEEFKKHWHSQSDFKSDNLEIISKPFKVCRISNFLRDEKIIENLKSELDCYNHKRKALDLYQFEKTEDLFFATDKCVELLNRSFREDLTSWMSQNTNIKLNGKVSMSSARYYNMDYLLCHDDNMSDRRIAYIFYLTNNWTEEDGGALDLFDTDENGLPRQTVRSLIPEYNSLVFFEVVNNSYHQVTEVLTKDKCRWSINGWFHGPLKEDFHKSPRNEPTKVFIPPSSIEVDLHSWVTDDYLVPGIIQQIQKDVEMSSYTFLKGFLKESTYQQIASDLTSPDISWRTIGPPDMHRYEIADEQTLPKLVKDFCGLFKSVSFFQLLEKYTGLDLMPKKTKRPKMTLELQRWSSGCYTLLYDRSLLKDTSDESKTDRSNNYAKVDEDTAPAARASTSDFSTGKTDLAANEMRRELKRERVDDSSSDDPPSPANSPDKKKVARYLDRQSDVGMSSKHKHGTDVSETSSSENEKLSRSGTPTSDSEDDSASKDDEFLLDVIIQFHTQDAKGIPKTGDTIDFVDPCEQEGILIQVPIRDNHLCLVYRSFMICRLHKYLNHLYDGYSYTFICTYYE